MKTTAQTVSAKWQKSFFTYAICLCTCFISLKASAVEGYFEFNNSTNYDGTVFLGADDDFCAGSHYKKQLPGSLTHHTIGADLWIHSGGVQCGIRGELDITMKKDGVDYHLKINYIIPEVGVNSFAYTNDGPFGIRAVKDFPNPSRSFMHTYQFEVYNLAPGDICDQDAARIAIAEKAADRNIKNHIGSLKDNVESRTAANSNFGKGFWQNTTAAGSAVWYSCKIGKACAVWGDIYGKYQSGGNEKGALGFPVTDEMGTPQKPGAYCLFQGGSIYWSTNTGSHFVWGAIRDKWVAGGAENDWRTGFPKSDEKGLPNNTGVYQEFEFGNIYFKAGTSEAFIITGDIWRKWGELNWEKGILGFPTSDHADTPTKPGGFMRFENGIIYWSKNTSSHYVLYGTPVWDAYKSQNWEQGKLGFPTGDPYKDVDGTPCQKFEGGKIEGGHIEYYR